MDFRHEWKIEISPADHVALRSRLRYLMENDPHATEGKYRVRSLYFDTPKDKALREKINGVDRREKFRIRYYDGDTSFMRLEKKSKQCGISQKRSVTVTEDEARRIIGGDIGWMRAADPLIRELYFKMRTERLMPKTVVDYVREPFICRAGDVRVTFDSCLRTGLFSSDFLNAALVTVPAGDAPILMEVKWGAFLPDVIRDAIQMPGRMAHSFSKYAGCRIYG